MLRYTCSVENIVANSRLAMGELDLDLEKIMNEIGEDEVHEIKLADTQPGVQITIDEHSPTVTVYKSGKYNMIGAKSRQQLKVENKKLIDLIKKVYDVDEDVGVNSLNVNNLLVKVGLEKRINLTELNKNGLPSEDVEYTPEAFPALYYRSNEYDCDFSIFSTGYILSVKAKDMDDCAEDIDRFIDEFNSIVKENSRILLAEEEEGLTFEDIKEADSSELNIG